MDIDTQLSSQLRCVRTVLTMYD